VEEKTYLQALRATDREVFRVMKIMFIADCVSAWIKLVGRSVLARSTLGATDAETHRVPGTLSDGSDGVAGAARLWEHKAGCLTEASKMGGLSQELNVDGARVTTVRNA
jgi:hypothetical protein